MMNSIYRLNLIGFLFLPLLGCGASSSGGNAAGNEIFSEIAQLSVTCDGTDGGPATCTNSQSGKSVVLGWTSNSCSTINWSNLAAIENTTLDCIGGSCSAYDSVSWRSQATGAVVYEIGPENRTAVAWLNLVNHGASDQNQPQSGDVICCQTEAAQNADTHADIQSDKCALVP